MPKAAPQRPHALAHFARQPIMRCAQPARYRPRAADRYDGPTPAPAPRWRRAASFSTTDAPFEVALLLDTSGSTRAEVALIRRAANAFIEALRPGDRVAVLSFNTAEEGATKLATVEVQSYLTDNREALRQAVENVGASNGTPYYDALERVAKDIFREPPKAESRG